MISDKQLQANRANAQKSTGPKTEIGKSIASKNAITHGLRSVNPVVDGEDRAEFNEFRNDMIVQFAPIGPMERLLVDRIVHSAWRLRRIGRIEVEIFDFLRHPLEKDSDKNAENKSETARAGRSSRYLQQHRNQTRVAAPRNRFASFEEAMDAWFQTHDGILYTQNKWPSDPDYPSWVQSFDKFKEPSNSSNPELLDDPEILSDAIDRARAKTDSEKDIARLDELADTLKDTQSSDPPLTLGRAFADDLQTNGVLIRLSRYETTIERSMFKNLRHLQSLQSQRTPETHGDRN